MSCTFDHSRPCSTSNRAANRYTRADLDVLAKVCGIQNIKKKTMDQLCRELKELVLEQPREVAAVLEEASFAKRREAPSLTKLPSPAIIKRSLSPKQKKKYPLGDIELTDKEAAWCRCILHVAAKQAPECNYKKSWSGWKTGDPAITVAGKRCVNPYAVCSASTGTSAAHKCTPNYDYDSIQLDELQAYANLAGIQKDLSQLTKQETLALIRDLVCKKAPNNPLCRISSLETEELKKEEGAQQLHFVPSAAYEEQIRQVAAEKPHSRKKSPIRVAVIEKEEKKQTGPRPLGCDEQFTAKYTNRQSPPYPANQCCGIVLRGNDGRLYFSKADKNNVCKWVLHKG